jgi:hypothetical protein
MTVMSTGLMNELFGNRCPTVGEAVLRAKRKLVEQPKSTDSGRIALDTIARLISPAGDKLAEERAEHVLLFNLFGDPLLRLRYPKPVELDVPGRAVAGAALRVAGSSPVDGRAQVELVVPNGQLTFKQPLRTQYPSTSGDLAAFQEVYEKANDPRLTSVETTVSGGRFAAALSVPAQAGGKCLVRVFIEGSDDFAMGAAEVTVEKPQE